MKLLSNTKFLASAAMLTFGATVAVAQSGPTSTKRIPISKEQGGEVVAPRVDTVTVYKTDTVTVAGATRVDTVTVTRIDTVMPTPIVRPLRLAHGLYFGLGGGVMGPNGALYNPNSAGPTAQAQLGWQGSVLGLRGDVNWAKPGEDSRYSSMQADPDILNFSADAKLNIPFLSGIVGSGHKFSIYGIGGYTHTMYKNLPIRLEGLNPDGTIIVAQGENKWTHMNGWNAGGGASLLWGHHELFFETRVLAFNSDNIPQARQMPFVLGINLY